MKKGKFGIALFSAAILLAVLVMAVKIQPAASGSEQMLSVQVATDTGTRTLDVWTEDWSRFYAFLPGHVSLEQTVLQANEEDSVTLEGMALPLRCSQLQWNKTYTLAWEHDGTAYEGTLIFLPSAGTATMYLDTQSGSMNYIHEEKGNAERASAEIYDEAGMLNYRGSVSSIKGRGNSTWVVHEKRPYSLELTEKADLLQMGSAKKWILLADALDSSGLRNKIVYDFAAQAGLAYTPETRWTEVYLNGTYAGLYLLAERIELDPQRADLSPDGSIFSMDRDIRIEEDTIPYFVTESGQYLQVRESADIGALKKKIQAMEHAILSEDETQWLEYIDLDSWVKKYLIEEIFGSYDAGFQSQYFFCKDAAAQSKVYAGPVWDYDAAIGNRLIWALNSPQGLFAWRPEAMENYPTPWYHALYEKEAFREELEKQYREKFLPLLDILLQETMDAYVNQIEMPYQRNQIRWNVNVESLQEEAAYIAQYMTERKAFLSELWLDRKDFCILRLAEGWGGYYAYYALEPGTCFTYLPDMRGEAFLGWFWEDTDLPFDPEQPILEDGNIYPKWDYVYEAYEAEKTLRDKILDVYYYVPVGVLVLIGVVLLPLSIRKGRTSGKKTPSKTG